MFSFGVFDKQFVGVFLGDVRFVWYFIDWDFFGLGIFIYDGSWGELVIKYDVGLVYCFKFCDG